MSEPTKWIKFTDETPKAGQIIDIHTGNSFICGVPYSPFGHFGPCDVWRRSEIKQPPPPLDLESLRAKVLERMEPWQKILDSDEPLRDPERADIAGRIVDEHLWFLALLEPTEKG